MASASTTAAQRTLWPRLGPRWGLFFGMAVALLGFFALSLGIGSVSIPFDAVVAILWGEADQKPSWSHIIYAIRLPRALTALLAGAALSASGLQMQTLFRNPLADPFILGISAGASLGVALVVLGTGVTGAGLLVGLGFLGQVGVVIAAVAGAALVLGLVLFVGRRVQHTMTLLILGLMFGYLTGAVVSVLLYFSIPEQVQTYVLWTLAALARSLGANSPFSPGGTGRSGDCRPANQTAQCPAARRNVCAQHGLGRPAGAVVDHCQRRAAGGRGHRLLRSHWLFGRGGAAFVPRPVQHLRSPRTAAGQRTFRWHFGLERGSVARLPAAKPPCHSTRSPP